MHSAAKQLFTRGAVVIDLGLTQEQLALLQQEFKDTLAAFPEFLPTAETYMIGGFGALGNPASFHNDLVRKVREWAMEAAVREVFDEYQSVCCRGAKLENVIDRMMVRPKGSSVTKESWHRDKAVYTKEGDEVFGGWVSVKGMQHFTYVPTTHRDLDEDDKRGFVTVAKTKTYDSNKVTVSVPEGHMLIFFENLVHCVSGGKTEKDLYRVFTAWRLTNSDSPLMYPSVEQQNGALEEQAVIPLKSGQQPPMFAALHWTNWRDKLKTFSEHMQPQCIEERTVKSGADKGTKIKVVQRYMNSLRGYGFKRYKAYSERELAMYKPGREWELMKAGTTVPIKVKLSD